MSEAIWRVAQSVGFDDYELRPMLEAFAAALSKPTRHLTVTTTESGEAVMVSWQDDDHRILDVVWERKVPAAPVVSAEQIEDLAWLDVDEHGEIDRSSDHNKMMTAPQRCAFKRGARAILALRSAVEPMTDEQKVVEICERIGFGRVQQIAGDAWEQRHNCAPRGRMGVTVRNEKPASPKK